MKDIYFLSSENRDNTEITPRVPSNFLIDNGFEDSKNKRVLFNETIDGAVMSKGKDLKNNEYYVNIPIGNVRTYKPHNKQVPDCNLTREIWVKHKVKLKCIGKIKVEKQLRVFKYKYGGNKEGELYSWKWKWVEKYNNKVVTESDEIIEEKCKDVITARKFVSEVRKIAEKYDANFFVVTDGASATHTGGNKVIKACRDYLANWERENGFNDKEDWKNDITNMSDYYSKESVLEESFKDYIKKKNEFNKKRKLYRYFKYDQPKNDKEKIIIDELKKEFKKYENEIMKTIKSAYQKYPDDHDSKKMIIFNDNGYTSYTEPSKKGFNIVYAKEIMSYDLFDGSYPARSDEASNLFTNFINYLNKSISNIGSKNFQLYPNGDWDDGNIEIGIKKRISFKVFKESVNDDKVSFSASFKDVKDIVVSLNNKELNFICNGVFKESPYVFYRKVLNINGEPASFIEVYELPQSKGSGFIVVATKEKYRNKGYSKLLVNKFISSDVHKFKNIKKVIWKFDNDNIKSKKISKILGFKGKGNELEKVVEEKALSSKERNSLDTSDFGIPELRKYPLIDKNHVLSAIRYFNKVDSDHEKELAKNIFKAMKKYNIKISVIGEKNRLKGYLHLYKK